MKRPTVKAVLREARLLKRRKGGLRRANMEIILNRAWQFAFADDFKGETVDYVVKAEVEMKRSIDAFFAQVREYRNTEFFKRSMKERHEV